MKVSSFEDSPHYHPQCGNIKVFLEGSERRNVIFADEEGRHATLCKLDDSGNIIHDKDGNPKTEDFWGHVRIEIPQDLPSEEITTFECVSGGASMLIADNFVSNSNSSGVTGKLTAKFELNDDAMNAYRAGMLEWCNSIQELLERMNVHSELLKAAADSQQQTFTCADVPARPILTKGDWTSKQVWPRD